MEALMRDMFGEEMGDIWAYLKALEVESVNLKQRRYKRMKTMQVILDKIDCDVTMGLRFFEIKAQTYDLVGKLSCPLLPRDCQIEILRMLCPIILPSFIQ